MLKIETKKYNNNDVDVTITGKETNAEELFQVLITLVNCIISIGFAKNHKEVYRQFKKYYRMSEFENIKNEIVWEEK